ncbi:MAG: 30S ribosomal protein S4 [Endomicrobiia bacterium]|nr:30S ribosomal protein S4 [Endomicrobiia bacterium]
MGRYLGSVCKLCRREGAKLVLKGRRCATKCPIDKKSKKPGQHGANMRIKQSEYAVRLREKQKAKRIASLNEAQFYHYFVKASAMKGLSGLNLIKLLAMRLDSVVYLLGMAPSRSAARQFITHGHFHLNDKRTKVPGRIVAVGDKIKIFGKMSQNQNIPAFQGEVSPPVWLAYDKNSQTGNVVAEPLKEQTPYAGINEQFIVELYSK